MEQIEQLFSMYTFEIVVVMAIIIILLAIANMVNRIKISKALKKYKELSKFLSAGNSENVEETLIKYIQEVNFMKNSVNSLEMKYEDLSETLTKSIQRVGFIRYNAFDDIGSDLSFSVALLDGNSNGFVISNIHAREESNVYAKPIRGGGSTYPLSGEEKEALEKAMRGLAKCEG